MIAPGAKPASVAPRSRRKTYNWSRLLTQVKSSETIPQLTMIQASQRLAPRIPADRIAVGESGIFSAADLALLAAVGISTFLVGESLMRERDVESATRALIGAPHHNERHLGAAE